MSAITPKCCCDCEHVLGQRKHLDRDSARCAHKNNKTGIDLVTGVNTYKMPLCVNQRSKPSPLLVGQQPESSDYCGIEGHWFKRYDYPAELYHPAMNANDPRKRQKNIIDLGMGDLAE